MRCIFTKLPAEPNILRENIFELELILLTLIQACISNCLVHPVQSVDEITYLFPNVNDTAVEIWERISDFTHTLLGMWLLCSA